MTVRKALAVASVLGALALPGTARAQFGGDVVTCTNCSDLATQLIQDGREASSYATQLRQYTNELNMYTNMIQNTTALPVSIWGTVQSDIMQVQSIARGASLLAGNSGSILSQLNTAGSYANRIGNVPFMLNQFNNYQQMAGNNLNTMGQQLGLQQNQEANDTNILAALEAHSTNAVGQLQAIQAGNELSHQTGTQLLEIQTTLSTEAQMVGTQQAIDADRNATDDAWESAAINTPLPPYQGNPAY